MKTRIYTNVIGALAIAAVIASCSSAEKDKETRLKELKEEQTKISKEIATLEKEIAAEKPEGDPSKVKAKEVVVTDLQARTFEHYVKTQGAVESEQNIQVSAKTMGVITQVNVREGEMVNAGQTLAQIDNSLIVRGIEEIKSQLELANTVYDRQKNLWDQKIGTEVQFLQAKSQKEGLERRLASMQEQNEMTRIKAPVAGVVDAVDVKVGQNIAPGVPAARVVNNSDLKITARISEAYSNQLSKGDKIVVTFPDINKTINSKLTFVARNIDPLSRTFTVEADLPSEKELRPNMTAVVRVVFESVPSAIVVPINVIQNINNEKVVYVAEQKGDQTIARKKVVTIDGVYDNQAQVKGLSVGDKLITTGFQGLTDGDFIKI
ncbi:MAG TPA: efflux RND transporter periplasmic adaptor subunit [Cyclobacteriaceae bacterium]|nr:efflux RND transporter periplasmic adaptor subunit [Cyclobacteriaceae bacterium]